MTLHWRRRFVPPREPMSIEQSEAGSETVDQLCQACQKLGLERLVQEGDAEFRRLWFSDMLHEGGRLLASIKVNSFDVDPSCDLCRLFRTTKLGSSPSNSYEIHALPIYVVCASISNTPPTHWLEKFQLYHVALVLLAKGDRKRFVSQTWGPTQTKDQRNFIFRSRTASSMGSTGQRFLANEIREFADLRIARGCIDFCKSKHDTRCRSIPSDEFSRRISGFKLIDVETEQVVHSNMGVDFVALSYVWGDGGKDSETWPQVVRDAITVAKELEFRYLWVDKYCIDQKNDEEKHSQIANMNLIYARAELTIIAAAGSDCTYGLPGVSRPRHPCKTASVGKTTFTTVPPDVYPAIRQSTWFSRGWTFQEGMLSRRRLYFRDDQFHFECWDLTCSESFNTFPSHDEDVDNDTRSKTVFRDGILRDADSILNFDLRMNQTLSFVRVYSRFSALIPQLMAKAFEYSKRRLTYESDSLDAFRGVLTDFYSSYYAYPAVGKYQSYYGMFLAGRNHDMFIHSFRVFLASWYHFTTTRPQVLGGSADMDMEPTRVLGIPSWSWAGWRGRVDFGFAQGTIDKHWKGSRWNLSESRPPDGVRFILKGWSLYAIRGTGHTALDQTSLNVTIDLCFKDGVKFTEEFFKQQDKDFSSLLSPRILLSDPHILSIQHMHFLFPPTSNRDILPAWPARFNAPVHLSCHCCNKQDIPVSEQAEVHVDLSRCYPGLFYGQIFDQLRDESTLGLIKYVVLFCFSNCIYCLLIARVNPQATSDMVWERLGLLHVAIDEACKTTVVEVLGNHIQPSNERFLLE